MSPCEHVWEVRGGVFLSSEIIGSWDLCTFSFSRYWRLPSHSHRCSHHFIHVPINTWSCHSLFLPISWDKMVSLVIFISCDRLDLLYNLLSLARTEPLLWRKGKQKNKKKTQKNTVQLLKVLILSSLFFWDFVSKAFWNLLNDLKDYKINN